MPSARKERETRGETVRERQEREAEVCECVWEGGISDSKTLLEQTSDWLTSRRETPRLQISEWMPYSPPRILSG